MIYVITPYYKEEIEVIRRAHLSVLAQNRTCVHVLVADGHPHSEISDWNCQHIILPLAHKDAGSFARGVGASHALHSGAEYVAFIDADNWLENNHVSSLLEASQRNSTLITVSRRILRHLDGSVLDVCDPESDGSKFADTSTILIHKDAYDIIDLFQRLPREVGCMGDVLIWDAVKARNYATSCTELPTVNYVTKYEVHYRARNRPVPAQTTSLDTIFQARKYWDDLGHPARRRFILGKR